MFKSKVAMCWTLGVIYLFYIPANYGAKQNSKVSSWLNNCDLDGLSWIYLI